MIKLKKRAHIYTHLSSSKVKLSYAKDSDPIVRRLLIESVEFATGRRKLEKLYNELNEMNLDPPSLVWELALSRMNIVPVFDREQLAKIPQEGPLVFVANHPFGVVDGLILGYLVSRVRAKFMVLVNEVLCQGELFKEHFLPIDFRETREALQTNIDTRKTTLKRLQAGEALAIFPAGGVATSPQPWKQAEDLEWKRFVVKLIQKTKPTVIPLFVHGQNSRLFQIASKLSPELRLSLLMNEVRNKMGRQIPLRLGDPIPFEEIAHIKNRQELLDHLKAETFALRGEKRLKLKKMKRKKTKRGNP